MKDASITEAVAELPLRLGTDAFVIHDHWEADLCATGLASPRDPNRLVYISTFGKAPGRYDLSLELPPTPGAELPYSPAGEAVDVDIAELARMVRTHLEVG